MKLKILGNLSPYCKGDDNGISYMVTSPKSSSKIVLDLGYGTSKMFSFPDDFKNMHVFISHLHWDHFAELSALAYASMVFNNHNLLDEKFTLYIPKGYGDEMYYFIKDIFEDGFFELVYYDENDTFEIDGMKVSFQRTLHSVPCFAARITDGEKTICYTGDSGYSEDLIPFYSDTDILLHDSGFLRENKVHSYHSTAYEAGLVAKAANAKKLIVTHFWPEIEPWEYVEEAKETFENVEAARTGHEFEA